MRIVFTHERITPPPFVRFHYDDTTWDIIVHLSIPMRLGQPRELWYGPIDNRPMPYSVALVTHGSGAMQLDGRSWPVRRGSLLLVDPLTHARLIPDTERSEPLSLLPFSFNLRHPERDVDLVAPLADILAQWSGEPLVMPDGPLTLDDLHARRFHDLLLDLNSHALPGHRLEWFGMHQRAFELLAFTVVALAAPEVEDSPIDPGLQRVRREIERRFNDALALDRLAELAGLSPYYLCRKFKAAYGLAPQQFQQYLQMRAACSYLRTSTLRVKEIAEQTGFASPEHFTRLFRKRVGCAPSDYRQRHGVPEV